MTAAMPTVERNTGAVQVVHRLVPDGVQLPPLPTRADRAGHYQRVLLNTRTGDLRFFCADWRVHIPYEDREAWRAQNPGDCPNVTVGQATEPVPDLLTFVIDTWTEVDWPADERHPTTPWTYMTRDQGNAFVASLAPLAQHLVDNLFQVPGTNDLEWSAESVAAVRAIYRACDRDQQGPRDGDLDLATAGMVNFADAVTAVNDLVQPEWAEMNNTQLDRQADTLNRFAASTWFPQLKEMFGTPYHDGSGIGLDVYGARSWLYAYRAHEANHRPVIDAAEWFARADRALPQRVSADHSDDALAALAEDERQAAAQAGVKLIDAHRVLRSCRDELRTRILEEDLPRARAEVDRLKQATAVRAGLLGRIIGWDDPRFYSDSNAELGRRAGLTGEAVRQLRQALTSSD